MVLIKCCDISNEVRPMEVSEPWVDCLLEEYFNQVRKHIQSILYEWSFHMKFMKRAFGEFHKFHVK